MIEMRLEGYEELREKLRIWQIRRILGFRRGVKKAGEYILEKAKEITPVDTGALKESGYVRHSGFGRSIQVDIGFSKWYAVFVHEMTGLKHAPGTSAKFLEIPLRTRKKKVLRIVDQEMKKG